MLAIKTDKELMELFLGSTCNMIKILGFEICIFSGNLVLQALLLFLNLNINKSEHYIVYDIVYNIVSKYIDIEIIVIDIVYDIESIHTINGMNWDAPLDICSINVNDQRNRNSISAYANLCQLK